MHHLKLLMALKWAVDIRKQMMHEFPEIGLGCFGFRLTRHALP